MATVGDRMQAENLQGVLAVEGEEGQDEEFEALDEQGNRRRCRYASQRCTNQADQST